MICVHGGREKSARKGLPRRFSSFGSRVLGVPLTLSFLELHVTWEELHNEDRVRSGTQD